MQSMNHSNAEPKTKRSQLVLDVGLAPRDPRKKVYKQHEKSRSVYLSWRAVFREAPESAPQCNKPLLNLNCTLLQTISANPRTVSCSERERERERERGRGREGGREQRGSDWRKRGVLVHNYSRDLWPEKQFINHSAWANVLQIVLHAAAILVCVKRHNKPGWGTCLGGWWWGREKKLRLWVVADVGEVVGSQSFWGVSNKETVNFLFFFLSLFSTGRREISPEVQLLIVAVDGEREERTVSNEEKRRAFIYFFLRR